MQLWYSIGRKFPQVRWLSYGGLFFKNRYKKIVRIAAIIFVPIALISLAFLYVTNIPPTPSELIGKHAQWNQVNILLVLMLAWIIGVQSYRPGIPHGDLKI